MADFTSTSAGDWDQSGTWTYATTGVTDIIDANAGGTGGYSEVGAWSNDGSGGYGGSARFTGPGGSGTKTASWTWTGLTPSVSKTIAYSWVANSNRSSNVPWTIYDSDGTTVLASGTLNQETTPSDFSQSGSAFKSMGTVTPSGTSLKFTITDNANEYTIADAAGFGVTIGAPATLYPTAGDTAVVAHNVNVDGNEAVGASGVGGSVALTINSGVTLTIEDGCSLNCKGGINLAGTLQVGESSGGGTLVMDASGASSPTSQKYRIRLTANAATFRMRGTTGDKSVFESHASGGNAYINADNDCGLIDWQCAEVNRIGDASNQCLLTAKNINPGAATMWMSVEDCDFDACGIIQTGNSFPANASYQFLRNKFTNTANSNTTLYLLASGSPGVGVVRDVGNATPGSGNSIDKTLYFVEASITHIWYNTLLGGIDHPASGVWPDEAVSHNVFYFTGANGSVWRGQAGYNVFVHNGTDNPHTILPTSTGSNKKVHHSIFEYVGTISGDSGNCFYGGGDWTFEYNLVMRAEAAGTGQAAGAVTFPEPTCNVIHNTFYACGYPSGILMGDGAANASTYPICKSNLFWLPTGVGSGAIAVVDNATGINDVLVPTGCTHNGFINAASTRYQGNYSTPPGTSDVLTTGDPATKMVAPYRNIATWAVLQGSVSGTYAGKVADALAYLAADPSLGEDLYDHVWGGQAPTDANFQNAGHDGVTIGAVEFSATPTDPPENTVAPVISGTPTEGETLTSTTGTWTDADSYAYQWYAVATNTNTGGTPIGGATSSTYDLTSSEIGDYIYCVVTATNDIDSVDEPSNVLGPVAAAPVAPTITTTANRNHPENQTAVVTVAATGDTPFTWSITGGADQALFGINSSSGLLSFLVAPDYEDPQDAGTNNVYVVEVTATNDAGSDDLTLNITVTDVNEDGGAQPGPAYSALLSPSIPASFSPAAPPLAIMGA